MADRMTIQRFPKGLLDWLGMKGNGDTPHTLSEMLATTMDVGQLYLLDRQVSIIGNTPNISTDSFGGAATTAFTVPPGELWLVKNYSVFKLPAFPAATGWTTTLGYYRINPGQYYLLPARYVAPVATSFGFGYDFQWGELILGPGDQFAYLTQQGTYTTPTAMTMLAEYYRIQI
jgi:hypothetical protein